MKSVVGVRVCRGTCANQADSSIDGTSRLEKPPRLLMTAKVSAGRIQSLPGSTVEHFEDSQRA